MSSAAGTAGPPGPPEPGDGHEGPHGTGTHRRGAPTQELPPDDSRAAWATGGLAFAGTLMLVYGVLGILEGIAAVAADDVYATVGDYSFKFNLTTWGWIHIVVGALLFLTGLGILKNAPWAKVLGVVLAGLDVIANFIWLPYQPLWGLIAIGIGVFVIWALCTHHADRGLGYGRGGERGKGDGL
ncbi:DUF7144 family membrane protein [Streptomyces tsukubensis]|uniref:DUF7144 domain-containing protein n=1 Tax=Streptomyces tsukubensis TaxID=83656 RepID=A0A1V3ZYV9_9ACTN|nr:hypothetical protein [Streptomyces tsukubensis]OON71585.1 hypothetical protein B1H18_33270 [Streptomyces tsukubensis]QFR93239.1 hypothetical protein GBW32_09255 [Streptomyces tsukubensis]